MHSCAVLASDCSGWLCPQSLSHLSGRASLSATEHLLSVFLNSANVGLARGCPGVQGWCLPDKSLPSLVCSKGLSCVVPSQSGEASWGDMGPWVSKQGDAGEGL